MQILKFFKTNWFSTGLALIVVLGFVRSSLRENSGSTAHPDKRENRPKQPEKFTQTSDATAASATQSSLAPGLGPRVSMPAVEEAAAMAFFKRFKKVALDEHRKYGGPPASVLLAAAFVNSFGGQRELARQANSFYGLPCSPSWDGETFTDRGHCYRRYATAWESFRDFSLWLKSREWYAEAKKSAGKDPRKWAQVFDNQGVSEVEGFGAELLKTMQTYRMEELD